MELFVIRVESAVFSMYRIIVKIRLGTDEHFFGFCRERERVLN